MIHQLKTEAKYFDAVTSGQKPFEVRTNDRDFAVGDFLALNEITPHACNEAGEHKETGRCCLVEITYVLTDDCYVKDGFAVLGIRPCAIGRRAEQMLYGYDGAPFYTVPVYSAQAGEVQSDEK